MKYFKRTLFTLGVGALSVVMSISAITSVNAATIGSVGSWTTSTNSIPYPQLYTTSATYNGYTYVFGGYDGGGGHPADVYYAHLNSDGSVGSWTTSTNSLPHGVYGSTAQAYNGYLYVLGGYGSGFQNTVYYAHLNSDGSVGSWTTSTNSIPGGGLYNATSVINDGHLYIFGGGNGIGAVDYVSYAPINPDGSVGSWTASPETLPVALEALNSVVYNGYVYIMNGIINGSGANSTVYYAHLNSDGSVGGWTTSNHMEPSGEAYSMATVYNGYVFVFGGESTGTPENTVFIAPLLTDGSIGSWATSTSTLPDGLYGAAATEYKGVAYIIGGTDASNIVTSVYYAQLSGYMPPILSTISSNLTTGSSITVNVLSGATGNPDPASLQIISGPSHGNAFDPPGTITYTPNKGFTGTDSLVYQVCSLDDESICSQSTLTFDVTAASTVVAPDTGFGSPNSYNPLILLSGVTASVGMGFGLRLLFKKNRLDISKL